MSEKIDDQTKLLINLLYNSAIEVGLASGVAQLMKYLRWGPTPRLDNGIKEILMTMIDMSIAVGIHNYLIKKGILPKNLTT